MKHLMLLIIVLLVSGCRYEEPLTEEHNIPVDPAVVGLWQHMPDNGMKLNPNDQMLVLMYSNTEYLIVFSPEKRGEGQIYLRGYPIKIGGIPCVQVKVIGFAGRPVDDSENNLFDVAVYQFENNELIVKTLNPVLVNERLKGKDLVAAFLRHKDNKDLFIDQNDFRFTKVQRKR